MTRLSTIVVVSGALAVFVLSAQVTDAGNLTINTTAPKVNLPKVNLPKANPPTVNSLKGIGNSAIGFPALDASGKDPAKMSIPLKQKTYTRNPASLSSPR